MGKKTTYAVELSGESYLFQKDHIEKLDSSIALSQDTWIITDFENSLSRVMTVSGDSKYAAILAAKKLQEEGEFDEPITVIPIRKQKRDANSTDLCFTAVPTRLYNQYIQRIRQSSHLILLFPIYLLLDSLLKKVAPGGSPVAAVLLSERGADLLVGDRKTIYYAGRFVTFDESHEQNQAMWETLCSQLSNIESDHRISIKVAHVIRWMNAPSPVQRTDKRGIDFHMLKEEKIEYEGKHFSLSFFYALNHFLSPFQAIIPFNEKIFFFTAKLAPYISGIMLVAILFFFSSALWYRDQSIKISERIELLEKDYSKLSVNPPDYRINENFAETLNLIQNLKYNLLAPSFRSVLKDLSDGMHQDMRIESLKLDYLEQMLTVEAFGKMDIPFNNSYRGFQNLIATLEKKGYRVTRSRFDTAIKDSTFLINLEKIIQ